MEREREKKLLIEHDWEEGWWWCFSEIIFPSHVFTCTRLLYKVHKQLCQQKEVILTHSQPVPRNLHFFIKIVCTCHVSGFSRLSVKPRWIPLVTSPPKSNCTFLCNRLTAWKLATTLQVQIVFKIFLERTPRDRFIIMCSDSVICWVHMDPDRNTDWKVPMIVWYTALVMVLLIKFVV